MNAFHRAGDWTEISDPDALVKDPVLSVHMIAYNHERFIAEAIEGVLRQETEYPYELIIGDDCSEYGTRPVALEYQRRFPKVIRVLFSDSNVGLMRNARRVVEASRGKYIAVCEGDDYWHNRAKLQQQTDVMERDDQCTIVHSDFDHLSGSKLDKSVHRRANRRNLAGDILDSLLISNYILNCTVCLRTGVMREFFGSPFGSKGYPMYDYPLFLMAARCGRVGYVDQSLATHRRLGGSVTRRGPASLARVLLFQRQVRKDYIETFGCSEEARRGVRIINNLNALMASALTGDQEMFFEEFSWFRRNNPDWRGQYKHRLRFLIVKWRLSWLLRLRYQVYLRAQLAGFCK